MPPPRTFIIAEVGVNHGGDPHAAWTLAALAKDCGAAAVKFQAFNSQRLWGDDRIAHLELSEAQLGDVASHCTKLGIEFMCTPFGMQEVAFLAPLVKRWKVASGCINRPALLAAIAATHKPVIMSTGMSTLDDIRAALPFLGYWEPAQNPQSYALLHCTSAYPCPPDQVNLEAMGDLRFYFGDRCEIGYSDHTEGINIAIAAVAKGATIIEKHLTFDRNATGPDHKASIEPEDFRRMVAAIREVEAAMGDGVKRVQPAEAALRKEWGRG